MTDAVSFHHLPSLDAAARARLLDRAEADLSPFLDKVRPIIDAVAAEGDAALSRFAEAFDKAPVPADAIAVSEAEFAEAMARLDPALVEVLTAAADNIRAFHKRQMPEPMWMQEVAPGVFAGDRVTPIDRVALYVPRGKGSFPSVVLMTAIPAVVAGVPEPVIVTPPGPTGAVDDATLVAARLAGITRVFKCGGAQAVAAVAFGTRTVPRCHKIVGPGSPWVVAAKRLLADRIDPGVPAGPSESIVLADATADGRLAALDLIIESEHGPDSSAWLVTDSRAVAEAARDALPGWWAELGEQRAGFSRAVLTGDNGGIVLCDDFDQAIAFTNDYAPEHLMVHSDDPFSHLGRLTHAGEILLGKDTPCTLANYLLGPNAVLPTGGAARTHSPLGVHDFLKRSSLAYVTRAGFERWAEPARTYATYEGFDGHALAVSPARRRVR
jgi:histidinol dehydrogenase